jgi:hypothetical protein
MSMPISMILPIADFTAITESIVKMEGFWKPSTIDRIALWMVPEKWDFHQGITE